MPTVFYTGKLSPYMKWIVNFSNGLAWISGNARDTSAMKHRIKLGYEGACSKDVVSYDDMGLLHYTKIANLLLEEVNLQGRSVLDVGCGTGILTFRALDRGAKKVICGDVSLYMLNQCQNKATLRGCDPHQTTYVNFDAELIPFKNKSFDIALSGMVLGLVPNQKAMVAEMARVIYPGGSVAISIHGPEHYWEAAEALIRVIPKRYIIGYRIEFWPRSEAEIQRILTEEGLVNIRTRRLTYKNQFETGAKAHDFFAATSAAWWNAMLPPEKTAQLSKKVRQYFDKKYLTCITTDIILAYGERPEIDMEDH